MLQPLSAPPPFITLQDHAALTSSTPASFADIPPVLRWTGGEVEVVISAGAGGGVVGWEGKRKGVMWVTEDAVAFLPATPPQTGFTLPFPSLTLHALTPASPDTPAHLYCQVDESDAPLHGRGAGPAHGANGNARNGDGGAAGGLGVNGHSADADADEEADDAAEEEFAEMRELRVFVPEGGLHPLFSALSSCSALHASLLPSGEASSFGFFPSNDDIDDGDGEDDAWEDADEDEGDDGRANGDEDEDRGHGAGRMRVNGAGPDEADDPVARFESLIQWGNVPRPAAWKEEEAEEAGQAAGAFEDAEELKAFGGKGTGM